MEALIVEFRIHAQHIAAFEAAILDNARASRETEPGCVQFDVCRHPAEPELFYLYELYTSEAAIQAHLQAPHFLAMDAMTSSWVASKTVRRLHRQAP